MLIKAMKKKIQTFISTRYIILPIRKKIKNKIKLTTPTHMAFYYSTGVNFGHKTQTLKHRPKY